MERSNATARAARNSINDGGGDPAASTTGGSVVGYKAARPRSRSTVPPTLLCVMSPLPPLPTMKSPPTSLTVMSPEPSTLMTTLPVTRDRRRFNR